MTIRNPRTKDRSSGDKRVSQGFGDRGRNVKTGKIQTLFQGQSFGCLSSLRPDIW